MSFYEIVLLVHIAAVVVWLGSGFLFHVLAFRAERARDDASLGLILREMGGLSNVLFIPASLVVLAAGVLLVLDGPWSFGNLWIVIALVGFAVGFVTGAAFLGPTGARVAAIMERDGGMSPAARLEAQRLVAIARIDYVVLVVILMAMVLKPTADDPAPLLLIGTVLVAGVGYFANQARSLPATADEAAPPIATA
jgi:uncharacterized membrane protein